MRGKPGPKAVPLSQLALWESLWFPIFVGLRGREPSAIEEVAKDDTAVHLREELDNLKESLGENPEDARQARWWARQIGTEIQTEKSFFTQSRLAEPEVWESLVKARTADQVRRACSQSKRWLDPGWRGRPYVRLLHENADQFVRAKRDRFYPRSTRPSSENSRSVFFARVMAGIACGIAPSTAVDRLRKMRHGDDCPCIHCDIGRQNRINTAVYGDLLLE